MFVTPNRRCDGSNALRPYTENAVHPRLNPAAMVNDSVPGPLMMWWTAKSYHPERHTGTTTYHTRSDLSLPVTHLTGYCFVASFDSR
ncbi:hypothetical protein U1Q18_026065 [Sarracenia purpurea var. burkii]